MKKNNSTMSRRNFLAVSGAIAGTTFLDPKSKIFANSAVDIRKNTGKTRIALVVTGVRGINMWGRSVVRDYGEYTELVGLSDKNPGRLETGRQMIGVDCPTFADFEKMMHQSKPQELIVTADDDTHDNFIEKGMEMGADIICEKPMAIDENKIQKIINSEKKWARNAGSPSITDTRHTGRKYGKSSVLVELGS